MNIYAATAPNFAKVSESVKNTTPSLCENSKIKKTRNTIYPSPSMQMMSSLVLTKIAHTHLQVSVIWNAYKSILGLKIFQTNTQAINSNPDSADNHWIFSCWNAMFNMQERGEMHVVKLHLWPKQILWLFTSGVKQRAGLSNFPLCRVISHDRTSTARNGKLGKIDKESIGIEIHKEQQILFIV